MRISDVARAAGCSVRAVRHLHETGAVPEPPRTAGNYRDYSLRDLAAVIRARALIDAGVPTSHINHPFAVDRSLELIDARIEGLTLQRQRLAALQEAPLGLPDDLRRGIVSLLGDTDYARGEIETFDLMAMTGVATPDTWEQLRANLADDQCRSATLEFAAAWGDGDVDKLKALLPRTVMRGIAETLIPGDLPIDLGDTGLDARQRATLKELADDYGA